MSKIIKDDAGCLGISHVVETEGGEQYAVNSVALDFMQGSVYGTAVFRWNKNMQAITNWLEVFSRKYSVKEEMLSNHRFICENLEWILNEADERNRERGKK